MMMMKVITNQMILLKKIDYFREIEASSVEYLESLIRNYETELSLIVAVNETNIVAARYFKSYIKSYCYII